MMEMFSSPPTPIPFSLISGNAMPDDCFARVVNISDNLLNRSGIGNWGRRSLAASPNCYLIVSDDQGRFDLTQGGTTQLNKNIVTMKLAELCNRTAIEIRSNPLDLSFKVDVDLGFNPIARCHDHVSLTIHCQAKVYAPARLFQKFGLSLDHPCIKKSMVEQALQTSAMTLSDHIDPYGNVDPRQLYGLFKDVGLYLVSRPVLHGFRSAREKVLEDAFNEWTTQQKRLIEEKNKASCEMEKIFSMNLGKFISDLSAAGMDPEEINKLTKTYTDQMQASILRSHTALDMKFDSESAMHESVITRLGNPALGQPSNMQHLSGASSPYIPANASLPMAGGNPAHSVLVPPSMYQEPYQHRIPAQNSTPGLNSAAPQRPVAPQPPSQHRFGPQLAPSSGEYLVCRDCGERYEFTVGEQAYFLEHKLAKPSRCPSCRRARKIQQQNSKSIGATTPVLHFGA